MVGTAQRYRKVVSAPLHKDTVIVHVKPKNIRNETTDNCTRPIRLEQPNNTHVNDGSTDGHRENVLKHIYYYASAQ